MVVLKTDWRPLFRQTPDKGGIVAATHHNIVQVAVLFNYVRMSSRSRSPLVLRSRVSLRDSIGSYACFRCRRQPDRRLWYVATGETDLLHTASEVECSKQTRTDQTAGDRAKY
jgi:hypothetical protein